MDEFELRRIIYDYIKEICHYSQMQVFSTSSYQRNYFQLQIDDTINGLINFLMERDELSRQQNELAHQVELMQQQEESNSRATQEIQETQETQENQETQTGAVMEPRIITMEELAENDGSNGKKAYVAVNGNVYDVSLATRWGGGTHFGLYAGKDLTSEFVGCHNAMYEILRILPIIGVLQK